MLELDSLSRRYGNTVALDGLSMTIPPGEVVGFLGPNGAGKTTAMRAILGITELDSGSVTWNGQPVTHKTRKRFGYMPEERGLFPSMTVRDELIFMARLHDLPKDQANERVDEIINALGLEGKGDEKVESLSLGNQQRVQLATSLIHQPDLLVLDEPFSGLDPTGIEALSKVLAQRAHNGAAVMFSSHQLDLVEHICESVVIINKGRHVTTGKTSELTVTKTSLSVEVDGDPEANWARAIQGLTVESVERGRARVTLDGATPDQVLDAARSNGQVVHFSFTKRRLSELFSEKVTS